MRIIRRGFAMLGMIVKVFWDPRFVRVLLVRSQAYIAAVYLGVKDRVKSVLGRSGECKQQEDQPSGYISKEVNEASQDETRARVSWFCVGVYD